MFAILQMYDFSSKSQLRKIINNEEAGCLRYCKCKIFQANHNSASSRRTLSFVVCDTANVRSFNQILIDGEIKTNVRGIVCNISILLCALFCMLFCQQKKRCTWVCLLSLYKLNCVGRQIWHVQRFLKQWQSTLAMRAILGNVVGAKRQIVCEDTIP